MKTIADVYSSSPAPAEFARAYFTHLADTLARVDSKAIGALIEEFMRTRSEGRTVFVAGNGGSAATSSHMVNDIAADVARKANTDDPFRVISLTDNVPLMTAIGNDSGFDLLFVNQLRSVFSRGDRLLLISASGNSPNLLRAAEWVKEHSGRVLSLVGFDGGQLKRVSDLTVHVQTAAGEYGPVEDAHLIINHIISNWLIQFLRTSANR
ncbi:MAG: SIS domain-containing protein [Gemmatimonadetes bacterium]|nr:SIS domain-containing protein [Gemmatimonadota bacterium]